MSFWTQRVRAHVMMIVVNVIFGGMNVLMGKELDNSTASFFVLYRLGITVPLIWALTLAVERGRGFEMVSKEVSKWRTVAIIISAGLIGVFVNMYFFTLGLTASNADLASIFQPMTPVVSSAAGLLMGQEVFSWQKVIGITIAAGGTVFVMLLDGIDGSSVKVEAFVFLLLNTSGAAFYSLFLSPLVRRNFPPIFLTAVANTAAFSAIVAVVSVTIALDSDSVSKFNLPTSELPCLFYSAIGSSIIGYSLMTLANMHLDATLVNLYVMLQPAATAILSILFDVDRKDATKWSLWTSAGLIGLGLVLTNMGEQAAPAEAGEPERKDSDTERRGETLTTLLLNEESP